MQNSYWNRVLERRLSRRRALAAAGVSAGAAAILAACGSDSGGGTGGQTDNSGLIAQPVDTFKQAKRGGAMKHYVGSDPNSFDPVNTNNALNGFIGETYSGLLREEPGYLKPSETVIGGDLAEKWEFSGDKLQIIMKLRPGVKWHNRAPVNGRAVDMDDVLFSWDRFASLSALRALVYNAVNASAPVLSVTATDSTTLVAKLKEPLVYAHHFFAPFGSRSGNLHMVPKEADGGFDLRNEMIGHGPLQLESYQPSIGMTQVRNPDYWDKDFILFDKLEMPIISESASRLAQFKAGNILNYSPSAADILSVKREEPRLLMFVTDFSASSNVLTFGVLPEGKSPFLDERVRQAFSMGIDRDLWIDAAENVDQFASEGLSVETRWSTHLLANWDGWWLDPKGKDFGANAKYFQHDIAEAKKLLSAAGYPDGFDTVSHYPKTARYSTAAASEPTDGMIQELGIRLTLDVISDYDRDYIPNVRDASGQFEGYGYHSVAGTTGQRIDPVGALSTEYWSKAGFTFNGFSTTGKNDQAGDPQLDALIEKARQEYDIEARRKVVHDIQRHLAKAMWGLNMPGGASGFTMAWPALQNFRVWRGGQGYGRYRLWLDTTKAPFV
jgi:peptide/nickel transport system substrate-binding protein